MTLFSSNITFEVSLTRVKNKNFIGGGVNGGDIYMCVRRRRDYRGALVAAAIVTARLSLYPFQLLFSFSKTCKHADIHKPTACAPGSGLSRCSLLT